MLAIRVSSGTARQWSRAWWIQIMIAFAFSPLSMERWSRYSREMLHYSSFVCTITSSVKVIYFSPYISTPHWRTEVQAWSDVWRASEPPNPRPLSGGCYWVEHLPEYWGSHRVLRGDCLWLVRTSPLQSDLPQQPDKIAAQEWRSLNKTLCS